MDFGFVTHAVHANSRLVYLKVTSNKDILTVRGPPSGLIYPPGPGWLHIIVDGIPSEGMKVMVGSGEGPAVDETALQKFVFRESDDHQLSNLHLLFSLLENTAVDQYGATKGNERVE